MKEIEIICEPGAPIPQHATERAAAVDLRAYLPKGPALLVPQAEPTLIGTGIRINMMPYANICAMIVPRSGVGNKGLVLGNTLGIIDADYHGEIVISAWNRNPYRKGGGKTDFNKSIQVNHGDRIAQLVFMPYYPVKFHAVAGFASTTKRGEGGFGSTGVS